MGEIFYRLESEKQKRIINACLHIFSNYDYKHASTDLMATEARIAKGSLFQYFKNKKALYIFLYKHALTYLEKKATEKFNFEESDYFERLKEGQRLKITLLEEYPYLYDFVIVANSEKYYEIEVLVKDINEKMKPTMYNKFFQDVDYSRFREGTNIENINKMIYWCSEGIWKEGINNNLSVEEMYEQVVKVYNFYKSAVYKGEYLSDGYHT